MGPENDGEVDPVALGGRMRVQVGLAAAVGVAAMAVSAWARADALDRLDGLFGAEQAERGGQAFSGQCASCHTPSQAAGLFVQRSAGARLGDYHARLSGMMPPQSEVRPNAAQFLDIIAYLAREAGAKPGPRAAALDDPAWREARVAPGATVRQAAARLDAPMLEWRSWRGAPEGLGYSPASQIDRTNVSRLTVAWRWSGANFGPTPAARNITTPLMADGVLFATAGPRRDVVAIDAATGETLWLWRPQETDARFENAPRKGSGRGVAWWSSGAAARIFTVTPGFHLAALDARTGRPVEDFGVHGQVDLMEGLRGAPEKGLADIGSSSPPLVVGDVVVVGPAHSVGLRPRSSHNVKGDVRGFDVRTGRLVWTFHTIPAKGEPGYDTWAPGTAERTGNAGVWAPMSLDSRTGAIFLPVENGTSDLYGGERPGQNLNASTLVSLDGRTGKVRWKRQLVHHDIWDWDIPAQPMLVDIPGPAGTVRHAVAQITKQSLLFVFDRDTGEPIWPIEERPAPRSDVPGEATWPTQPFPTLPAPYDRVGIGPDDLIDFTPALRAEALAAVNPYRLGGWMAPPSLDGASDGTHGTLSLPSFNGGANWWGGAYDPETGLIYVGSMTIPSMLSLQKTAPGSDIRYQWSPTQVPSVEGLPLVKPPWGRITAIDLTTGRHAWMVANADTPRAVAEHPALKGIALPRTGIASQAGLLVTKTLLFAGEGEGGSPLLRAHDKRTGEIVAAIRLPASQVGLPMTYVWKGRQYIVLAVDDGRQPAEIVALALSN
jgi:quinoprotein glucose dehydrogenase